MKISKCKRMLSLVIALILCLSMVQIPVVGASEVDEAAPDTGEIIETVQDAEPSDPVFEEAEEEDLPPEEEAVPESAEEEILPESEEDAVPSEEDADDTAAQLSDVEAKADEPAQTKEETVAVKPKKKSANLAATAADGDTLEISATSPNVSRSDLISVFGDRATSTAYYGIASADTPNDINYVTLISSYNNVSQGAYIAYKTTTASGSIFNRTPDWTQATALNVTVKLYYTASFSVSGSSDGEIYLNGEAVSGSKRVYTDEQYTVTAKAVDGYTYTITGAEDGVAFTPNANMTISAKYEVELNAYATIALTVGEGGEAVITSDGETVTNTVAEGKTFAVTATPKSLYELESVVVTKNGTAVDPDENGEYGPVADGESYEVTVTFAPASPANDIKIERDLDSATVNKADLLGFFGDNLLSSANYGIAPADNPTDVFHFSLLNTLATYPVPAGRYIVYKASSGSNPDWTKATAFYLSVRTYTSVTFEVIGPDDGEIYLNGEAVSGEVKLYTDTEYTVTAKAITDYEYVIDGAEDGVAFTPDADTADTISVTYTKNQYAGLTLTVGEGGTATVTSAGDPVNDKVMAGDTFTVTATPAMLYELDAIAVTKDGEAVEADENGEYGPVADGEAYEVTVTFAPASSANDIKIERDLDSATVNKSDILGFFGDGALSSAHYGIAPADAPDDVFYFSLLNTLANYDVAAGRYIVYKTTENSGSILNPSPVWSAGTAYYVSVRTYASVDFDVIGSDDGEIYLNGEAVSGAQKLYTDTEYTVTAKVITDYEYVIDGAEDGVAFTPDAETADTISVTYTKNQYATITLTVGDGGEAEVRSAGALVTDKVMAGNTFTVTATAKSLYEVESITVTKDGEAVEADENGEYGPVADGEAYEVTVTFAPASSANDIKIERDLKSATVNKSDILGFFGDGALSSAHYGIAPADAPDDVFYFSLLNTLANYDVAAGRYIVYKTTENSGSILNPSPVWSAGTAYYVSVRTYASVDFDVIGSDDGEIYLNGEAVTGTQKLYTDTQYIVTAKALDDFVYSIAGAEDGVSFTPDANTADTISVTYIQNTYATVTVTANEGGDVALTSNGEPVVDKVPAGSTFKVTATADKNNNYFVDSIVVTKGGVAVEADENGEYGPVADGEEYEVVVTFTQATLTLADCNVNIIDIENKNFDAVEQAIIDSATFTPDTLLDGADITVEFVAGSLLSLEYYQSLDYTSLLTHAFGTSTLGGTLEVGNTEKVRVTYKIPSLGLELQATATATVSDQRIPTTISGSNITITYGDDLKAAILDAIIVNGADGTVVTFTEDDITIDPETLNVTLTSLLSNQDVTVKYGGSDEYAASEGTISVYVRQAESSLDVKSETITYGETPALQINTDPEGLDIIRIIGGIDGDAAGFISIDIPESTKELMKIKLGDIVLVDFYDLLSQQIGDGVSLNGFKGIIDNLISIVQNPVISAAISAAGFDIESLQGVFDFISNLPGVDVNAKITLGNPPKNAGIYLVGAVSADLNYRLAGDVGYLAILPKTATEEEDVALKFRNDIPGRLNTLTYEEAQEFGFGGDLYVGDSIMETTHVRALYLGTTYDGNISVQSSEPIREPGVYTETIYVLGGNYLPAPISRVYIVSRLPFSIKMDDATFTYDGTGHALTAYAEDGETDLGDRVTYLYTGLGYLSTVPPVNAGTYLVTATYAGDATHQPAITTATLTIIRAEAVIKATCAEEVTYGDVTRTNLNAANLGYEVEGLYNNDILGVITPYVRNPGNLPHVGEYTVGISLIQTNFNYKVSAETASFKIVPRDVTIVIENKEKYYGDADPKLTYHVDNLPSFDSVTVRLARRSGEDVGTYPIYARYLRNPDLNISLAGTGTFTIKPMPVAVTVNSTGKEFGDADPKLVLYSARDIYGRPLTAKEIGLSVKRAQGEDVGVYPISVEIANSNYVLDESKSKIGTFTIYDKKVIVKVKSLTKVYGDDDPAFVYTLTDSSGRAIDPETVGFEISRAQGDDVGTYAISYKLTNESYTIDESKSNSGTLTILPRYVVVKMNSLSKLYGDSDPEYNFTVKDEKGNALTADEVGLKITRKPGEDVGRYAISYQITNGNYALDKLRSTSGTLTITARPVTVKIDSKTKTFGSPDPAFSYSITDKDGNKLKAKDVGLVVTRKAGEKVGEYPITAVVTNPNYVLDKENSEFGTLTIAQKGVIVKIKSQTKTYGDKDPKIVYTVTDENGRPLIPRLIGLSITREPGENVGEYKYTASVSNENFAIDTENSDFGTLTIAPKNVIVKVKSQTKTYGDKDPRIVYTVTDENGRPLVPRLIGLSITREPGENVGEYKYTASVSNENFAIDTENSKLGALTILPKEIIVTVDPAGKTFGDDDPEFTYTVTDKNGNPIDPDDVGVVITRAEGDDAGEYPITIEVTNGNYTITDTDGGKFVIEPKEVIVTVTPASKTYGEDNPTFEVTVTDTDGNPIDPDEVGVVVTREPGENAGEYPITIEVTNGNYTLGEDGSDGGKFVINKADATVTINCDSEVVYGDISADDLSAANISSTISGLVGDDELGIVKPYITNPENMPHVGDYEISAEIDGLNSNYNVTVVPANVKVTPRPAVITVDSKVKYYGDADPELTYSISNLVGDDTIDVTLTRASGENVGVYAIDVEYTENPDYTVTIGDTAGPVPTGSDLAPTGVSSPATLTILPRPINVTVTPASKEYGEDDPEFEYTITDDEGNPIDPEGVDVVITREPGEDAGEYPVTVQVNSENYTLNDSSTDGGTFVIKPKQVIITVEPVTKEEGDSDPEFKYTITDEDGNPIDPEEIGFEISREPGEEPGKYQITVKVSNPNYIIDTGKLGDDMFLTIEEAPTEAPKPAKPSESSKSTDDSAVTPNGVAPKTGSDVAIIALLIAVTLSLMVVLVFRKRRERR